MNKQIAVIDDSPPFRLLVQQLLELQEHDVYLYEDADSFFRNKSMLPSYDLIIADINMPGMNGLTALDNLKANADTAAIPVLLVTGDTNKNVVVRAIQGGVDDFIGKPIEPREFTERVARILLGSNKKD